MTSPEQFTALYAVQNRVAQRCAAATMQGAQHIFSVQMEASREVLSRNGERWRDALQRLDPATNPADWTALMQVQVQCALDMARTTMEGTARVCEAYVRTMQEQGRAVAEAYRESSSASARTTQEAADTVTAEQARESQRAAEEAGRQAADAVAMMAGQPTGAVAAARSEDGQGDASQRRRQIIRP